MNWQKIRDWRLNQPQREGTARVLDGFTIASGIALYSYYGDHLNLTKAQVVIVALTGMLCYFLSLLQRRK
ncbi:MAG: hypothetical protein QM523_02420 [Candidatus Pacebacteria bacterium]|nr:hypothetical protein [Candidatus Paceibacterota bacterium]